MLNAGLFIGKELLNYFKALIIALAKLKEIEQLDCKFNFLNLRRHLDFRFIDLYFYMNWLAEGFALGAAESKFKFEGLV